MRLARMTSPLRLPRATSTRLTSTRLTSAWFSTIACAAGMGMITACAHNAPETGVVATSTGDITSSSLPSSISPSAHWGARITPIGTASARGRVDITPARTGHSAAMILVLNGLAPDGSYVWHIRRGLCDNPETAGPPSEYAPLTVDADGRGSATGTLPITDPNMTGYHIDIHPAGGPAVACGNLETAS